jgi:putative DNA primase/helicase
MALVAIPSGKKGPSETGWNLPENTITSADRAAFLTGNVGLAHAYCKPNPTAALDIDDIGLAEVWLGERGVDLNELLDAENAVQIISGKVGRAKLLYHLPAGTPPVETIQIKDGDSGKMILEFRCASSNGLTVQDVLPPSIHPETGAPYMWGGKGHWCDLPENPVMLMEIWQAEIQAKLFGRPRPNGAARRSTAVDDTPRQRAILADCSYDIYRNIVWALLSFGWHDAEELVRQWCMTAPSRFNDGNFNCIAGSYSETRTPTRGTIIHHARKGGWNG